MVLIESDWNLKSSKVDKLNKFVESINRIRLEFKGGYYIGTVAKTMVLIESDWNLKEQN